MTPSRLSIPAKLTCLLMLSCAAAASAQTMAADYGKLPLSFEANRGQTDSQVKFLSHGNGYGLFLTNEGAVLTLTKPAARAEARLGLRLEQRPAGPASTGSHAARTDVLRMQLAGARSQAAAVTGEDPLPGTANYFLGNDPAKWHTGVPTYGKVKYAAVYPGIDLVYYGNQRQLEYDFVVAPQADPKQIRLHFDGAKKLKLTPSGDLQVVAQDGEIAFHKPVVYQMSHGQRETVEGSFQLLAKNEITFKLSHYDLSRELVIDPTLAYSTYLGGNANYTGDVGRGIAVDTGGNSYVVGSTGSTNFPVTSGAYQPALNVDSNANTTENAFIVKLNSTGTALVYATYLGGSGTYYCGDSATAVAVDATGSAYITGSACSTNFPTMKPYQASNNSQQEGPNAFITKINPTGSSLVYSTYLGGSGKANCCNDARGGDIATGVALAPGNLAYVTGTTFSTDFPITADAYQKQNNSTYIDYYGQPFGYNPFVTALTSDGGSLVYSSYLGGSSLDSSAAIAVDGIGNAYITGTALSAKFPVTSNAFQKTNNSTSVYNPTNAFISKFDVATGDLTYSTYLGGSGNRGYGDASFGIAVDNACFAYVTGQTASSNFPVTKGAFQGTNLALNGPVSSFVTKINKTGSALEYSTYLSGDLTNSQQRGDVANAITVDPAGQAYVTGFAQSLDFPHTSNAYQAQNAEGTGYESNAFVFELSADGSAPVYGSYLGGTGGSNGGGGDAGEAIALDLAGNAYLAGVTLSTDFPILPNPGAFQTSMPANTAGNQNRGNAFVAKFSIGAGAVITATTTTVTADANPASAAVPTTFTASIQQPTQCGFPPTGTASFVIDGGSPIKVALNATGQAAYTTSTLSVGKHTIDVSYSGDAKYEVSSGSLTETIVAAPASIAAVSGAGQTAIYGATYAKPLTVIVKDSAGSAAPGVSVAFSGTGLEFSPATILTNESGEASVSVTATGTGTLTAKAAAADVGTAASFTLAGSKAVLTLTATSIKVPYNDAIPALTYTVAGYVNGDSSKAYTGTPSETTTAKKGSAPGTYPLTIATGSLAAANYTFKFVDGTVTITNLGPANEPTFSIYHLV